MLTFFDILRIYNLNTAKIKLVRHVNSEIDIIDTFQNNRIKFESYQSFQKPNKFSNAKHIAVFAPHRNTLGLFLGIWDIKDYTSNEDLTNEQHSEIDKFKFSNEWHSIVSHYKLEYNAQFDDLSQRLIIDWGKGTIAWVQSQDKPITEIRAKNSLGDLPTLNEIILSYQNLETLILNPDSNSDWLNVLTSVKGIYLIKDKISGKLYVGSAFGDSGIFGRWKEYVMSGDGGNIGLESLDPNNFEYSILEVLSDSITKSEVLHKENLWKKKLGTWETGLNIFEKHKVINK